MKYVILAAVVLFIVIMIGCPCEASTSAKVYVCQPGYGFICSPRPVRVIHLAPPRVYRAPSRMYDVPVYIQRPALFPRLDNFLFGPRIVYPVNRYYWVR